MEPGSQEELRRRNSWSGYAASEHYGDDNPYSRHPPELLDIYLGGMGEMGGGGSEYYAGREGERERGWSDSRRNGNGNGDVDNGGCDLDGEEQEKEKEKEEDWGLWRKGNRHSAPQLMRLVDRALLDELRVGEERGRGKERVQGDEEKQLENGLPVFVDGEAFTEGGGKDREREYWNSIMTEIPDERGEKELGSVRNGEQIEETPVEIKRVQVSGRPRNGDQLDETPSEVRVVRDFAYVTDEELLVELQAEEDSDEADHKHSSKEAVDKQTAAAKENGNKSWYANGYNDFAKSKSRSAADADWGPLGFDKPLPPLPHTEDIDHASHPTLSTPEDSSSIYSQRSAIAPKEPHTWNSALEQILSSSDINPSLIRALRHRQAAHGIQTTSGCENPTLTNTSLVPEFSLPVHATRFADHMPYLAERYPEQYILEDTIREREEAAAERHHQDPDPVLLTNGIGSSSSSSPFSHSSSSSSSEESYFDAQTGLPTRPPSRSRPSGLPRREEFHLLVPSPPSTPLPPEEQIRVHEGTIAVQAKLIYKLHHELDQALEQLENLEIRVLPRVGEVWEKREEGVERLERRIVRLEEERVVLRGTVDFAVRVLGTVRAREEGVVGVLAALEERENTEKGKGGILRLLARWLGCGTPGPLKERRHVGDVEARGGGRVEAAHVKMAVPEPDSAATERLSRAEVRAFRTVLEQNLRILHSDMEQLAGFVEVCKDFKDKTASRSKARGDGVEDKRTWRDV